MINDPTKWSKEDITKIERSLHRRNIAFIIFLEFHIVSNMKPKTNVAPSRKLNLKFKLDSTLIESNHIPLFTSWIDRKDSYK
uniref:Uncharacterized protein n=1 Tax=Rhizophagus irregularis (strain DAOM 181602 / DAOM 197198 / MUCL 43194) TaxID=747089 RepID=U9UE15_RHIID